MRLELYTKEFIVESIKKFYEVYGKIPTTRDTKTDIIPFGKSMVFNKFGTWNNAIIAAGLQEKGGKYITGEFIICANCGKEVYKQRSDLVKKEQRGSKNLFCNKSCRASYNNRNKTFGSNRSKLERFIEEKLRQSFPNLSMSCNDTSVIGAELDFYFPDLKFAVELNGIFHYEPIYGKDRLQRTMDRDRQKFMLCTEVGIELCVIDTSGQKQFNKKSSMIYYKIIEDLICGI